MEKVKAFLQKVKTWIVAGVVGAFIALVAWKKYLEYQVKGSDTAAESRAKELSAAKEAELKTKADAEAAEKQKTLAAEQAAKAEAERAKIQAEAEALVKLAAQNKEKYKKEVSKKLGIPEKKKGRPKKK